MREMSLSITERYDKLVKARRRVKHLHELDIKTFRVNPEIVIFQNFAAGVSYSLHLNLLNLTDVSMLNNTVTLNWCFNLCNIILLLLNLFYLLGLPDNFKSLKLFYVLVYQF